jgi:hypothetical protein
LRLHRNKRFSDFVERRVFALREPFEHFCSLGVVLARVCDQRGLAGRQIDSFE